MNSRPAEGAGGPTAEERSRRSRLRLVVVPGLALLWCVWTNITFELGLGPLRGLSVLLFLVVVPGLAVTGWLAIDDRVFEATLVVGIGAAVGVAIGLIQIWTRSWSPVTALWLLVLVCAFSLGCQLIIALRPKAEVGAEQ